MGQSTPTIVLVDDSAEVRDLLRTQFQLSGALEVVADGENGEEAISLAHEHQPDLLLLDMSMPQMDGLDALAGISAVSPSTRVVVFTGFDGTGLADKAQSLGAAALIEKSTPIEQLAARLLAVLHQSRTPPSPFPHLEVVQDVSNPEAGTIADQELLDEHAERFREVFERAAIGMATMTLTGGIVRANRALGDLMLQSVDELVGRDYATLTSGAGSQLDAALAEIGTGKVNTVQLEHDVSGSLEPRRVRATMSPVRDSEGRALYVLLQVQDITAQRAAEGKLSLSENRFRLLVEAVEEYAIFMLSPEGIVVSWNAGAQRNKGYRADEIIGQHFRTFYRPEQQQARHPEYELERALQDGHYSEEGWRVRKDGSEFWANVLITAVFDDDGEHIGFAKVTRDQSERRFAEDERDRIAQELSSVNASLEQLNTRLKRAADDQAQFLAMTTHELRTPTAVLGGSAITLARHWDELDEEQRGKLLGGMKTSANRLDRLLTDLLTASRIDASVLSVTPVRSSTRVLITNAVDAARTRYGIEVEVEESADFIVMIDPERMAQVLDNLISNALIHGAPPIRISAQAAGSMAQLRVSDSGPGVDPTVLPRLFERFVTGDSFGGTGLGLFIVRELARANGGDATYERDKGDFVLSLPLA